MTTAIFESPFLVSGLIVIMVQKMSITGRPIACSVRGTGHAVIGQNNNNRIAVGYFLFSVYHDSHLALK